MEKNEEVVQGLKQQALLSWFRTWLWLYLEEKRHSLQVQHLRVRPVLVKAPWFLRVGYWLRRTVTRPFRAWKLYRYVRLPQAQKERVQDAWLEQTFCTLYGKPPKTARSYAAVGPEDREEVLESDFVKYMRGEIT